MRPLLLDGTSVIEYRLSCTVIRNSKEPDPAVDPDDVCDFFFLQFLYLIRDGNIQKELSVEYFI